MQSFDGLKVEHGKEPVEVVLGASLVRCSEQVLLGGGLGADPEHTGDIISLGWSWNTSVLNGHQV